MICFSRRNGAAWNHFTREQIVNYFRRYFEIEEIKHFASIEGDDVMRHFYSSFMRGKSSSAFRRKQLFERLNENIICA